MAGLGHPAATGKPVVPDPVGKVSPPRKPPLETAAARQVSAKLPWNRRLWRKVAAAKNRDRFARRR